MTALRVGCAECRLDDERDEIAEWETKEAFFYWRLSNDLPLTLTAHQGKRPGSCAEVAAEPREGGAG